MKKTLIASMLIISSYVSFAQEIPPVYVNHFFLVPDSADFAALKNSEFIKEQFAVFIVSSVNTVTRSWAGCYMMGVNTYFELLDPSNSNGNSLGNAAIGLSVDKMNDLFAMDSLLKKRYTTHVDSDVVKNKMGVTVPMFITVTITDTVLQSSNIGSWIMAYTPDYFEAKHLNHNGDLLTREASLKGLDEQRENKIMRNFTSITLRADYKEKNNLVNSLQYCGFKKINNNSFASPDDFIIRFIPREEGQLYSLASVDFESNVSRNDTIAVSKQIRIVFHGKSGTIHFDKRLQLN